MPPKTKKELEEEARRLEEERKKKEEEEAALEAERKKYASEKLEATGLVLPITQLFLEEFPNKPLAFAEEILRRNLDATYPFLATADPKRY